MNELEKELGTSSMPSSFVHHFIVTCEFKLELSSGNT